MVFFVDGLVELQEVRELGIVEPRRGGIADVCSRAGFYHPFCAQASDNLAIIVVTNWIDDGRLSDTRESLSCRPLSESLTVTWLRARSESMVGGCPPPTGGSSTPLTSSLST